ncbi:hypothetical protein Bca4012_082891 [Brassica carinata]|uniref:Uncharacterized protein n=1 Tax=Brassica carinata TaxID=52824 RepID=A0A8X8ALR1_BRACI|nr:hypothetical protein Bca52824_027812 [Brassica carinata]
MMILVEAIRGLRKERERLISQLAQEVLIPSLISQLACDISERITAVYDVASGARVLPPFGRESGFSLGRFLDDDEEDIVVDGGVENRRIRPNALTSITKAIRHISHIRSSSLVELTGFSNREEDTLYRRSNRFN